MLVVSICYVWSEFPYCLRFECRQQAESIYVVYPSLQSAVVAYLPCHHVVYVWMPAQLLVGSSVDVYLLYLVIVADREIGQGRLREVLNLQQLLL